MDLNFDLEAQQVAHAAPRTSAMICEEEVLVGGAETNEMDNLGPHNTSVTSLLQSVSADQDVNEEQSVISQVEGVSFILPCCPILRRLFRYVTGSRGRDIPEMNIDPSQGSDDVNDTITTYDSESDLSQQTEEPPEESRMVGDFDGSSNALWSLFRDEAKSHDDARINTLKDDMDGVLIFVRSHPICTHGELAHTYVWSHRPVYFPLPSPDSYLIANKT